jgi:ADP-ribose pyrophosphatase YjhB (NUDIX family)
VTSLRRLSTLIPRLPPLLWGLRFAVRVVAPRQWVGAVGALFNASGEVLLLEHVFRTDYPWGLPGGWVERREDPSETVRREFAEELQLNVEVGRLLHCARVPAIATSAAPPHLGLGYFCRHSGGQCVIASEILAFEWVDPCRIGHELAPFQKRVIELGREQFEREAT